ncbi:MAG: hypothetical protein AAF842_08690 [Planctomycetota bacterium]
MPRPRDRLAAASTLLINLASGVWLGGILMFALVADSAFRAIQRHEPPVEHAVSIANGVLIDQFGSLALLSAVAWLGLALGLVLTTVASRHLPWARATLALVSLVLLAWLWNNLLTVALTHFRVYFADNRGWTAEMIAEVQTVFDNASFTSEILLLVLAIIQVGVLAITIYAPATSDTQAEGSDEPG